MTRRTVTSKHPTVWVTKYALTDGILKFKALDVEADGRWVTVPWEGGLNGKKMFHGDDWHLTEEAAIIKAFKMQKRKIESLKAQIKRLEDLNDNDSWPLGPTKA